MLVLTRKIGERIRIGDDIVVNVLEVSKGSVRIGIEAPKQIPIYRSEVYERILEENIRASKGKMSDIEEIANFWRERNKKE